MTGGKMNCAQCGKDISMSGSQICEVCDPDMGKIIKREVRRQTPSLCSSCFEKHVQAHRGTASPTHPAETNSDFEAYMQQAEVDKTRFFAEEADRKRKEAIERAGHGS